MRRESSACSALPQVATPAQLIRGAPLLLLDLSKMGALTMTDVARAGNGHHDGTSAAEETPKTAGNRDLSVMKNAKSRSYARPKKSLSGWRPRLGPFKSEWLGSPPRASNEPASALAMGIVAGARFLNPRQQSR